MIGTTVSFYVLYLMKEHNYLLFHCLTEFFSIVIAGGIFMLAWTSRDVSDNDYFFLIGTAFLCVALIDTLHTLAYSGMNILARSGADIPTQLWVVGRYIASLSFLIAPIFADKKIKASMTYFVYLGVLSMALISIFYWKNFPACFIENQGLTRFKIYSEYLVCFILAGAVWAHVAVKSKFDHEVYRLLIVSIVMTIFSEFFFTLYNDPYGFFNVLGHFFKIIAFFLLYRAVIVTGIQKPSRLLFYKLKKSEERVRSERRKLISILESMPDSVYIVNKDYEIEYSNPSMKHTFGEINGKKCYEYLRQGKEPCARCRNQEVFAGKTVQWEFKEIVKSKTYDVLETPLKNPDGTHSKLKIFRDITERKKAEEIITRDKVALEKVVEQKSKELLMQQERVLQSQRLSDVGLLASMVAHELRNPLAVIDTTVFNLRKKINDEAIRQKLDKIESKVNDGEAIITNLLFYSKIKEPEMQRLHLINLVHECVNNIPEKHKKITFLEHLDAIRDIFVQGDSVQLSEVFSNIMNNAIDAVDKKTGVIEIEGRSENNYVVIYLKDNGKGICEEIREKIFEPFFTTKSKGTGLGLSVCQQIIRNHNGELRVYNRKNGGTIVTVSLPLF